MVISIERGDETDESYIGNESRDLKWGGEKGWKEKGGKIVWTKTWERWIYHDKRYTIDLPVRP